MIYYNKCESEMSKTVTIPDCNKDVGSLKEEICLSPTDKKNGAISLFSRLLRLDTLSKKPSSPDSPTAPEPTTVFYGVYIPCEIKKGSDEEALHVYEKKSEALELVRKYKTARFKAFKNHQDAVSFALRGADIAESQEGCGNSLGEKPYPFKAPSSQDMVALRKSIEKGFVSLVRDRVWDNPRYLVSSGSTPAIVQEGARYNALHVAARCNNAEMCNLILTTVGDPTFVQTLYGAESDADTCREFATLLVDRYLNTPDKVANETPLHFASKFGAVQVVDVLTSLPQCNLNALNRDGLTPKDMVCSRASNKDAAARILSLLSERYYVPVLHSEDTSAPPTIGLPFTPAEPPALNSDPLSPRYEILAFAGPMAEGEATSFRRRWKTPPRSARPAFRLKEMTKGLEAVGRNLAEQMKIGWKEYWPFLDTFTDLRCPEGLMLLENYLKTKYESACSVIYNDSINDSYSPEELSISGTSGIIKDNSLIKVLSPMSELCAALETFKISDRSFKFKRCEDIKQRISNEQINQPARVTNNTEPTAVTNHTVSQLLCIERTCLVFAKRIADALIFSLTAEPEIAGESLKTEAKNLQHTIYSYMDDERFQAINFGLIHSRLAQLVVFKLKQQTSDTDDINNLVEFLSQLRCQNEDIVSSDEERKPYQTTNHLTCRTSRMKMSEVIEHHVRCLASFISEELVATDSCRAPATSEKDCPGLWEQASKCRCDWKVFERNNKMNASFRKSRVILSSSPKNECLIRRLIFDQDIGDGKLQSRETERPFNVNSPGGDGAPVASADDPSKLSLQMDEGEISEDESEASVGSDAYDTAEEQSDDDDDMHDASDRALAEPFIYGEEPTKMDRLVYEAVRGIETTAEEYPHLFRWRHTVELYTPAERDSWQPARSLEESRCSIRVAAEDSVYTRSPHSVHAQSPQSAYSAHSSPHSPRGRLRLRAARCSTPNRDQQDNISRTPPLQVSNWLRVTGPNSPRSALAANHVEHNVSFGF